MPPYARRGLHGQVVHEVGRRIVLGELTPGGTLDLEALEREYGVSRTVVREAVKVLEAKGLLQARPKRGTIVRERERWNLLDPDIISWRLSGGPDVDFLTDLSELREAFEPAAARLAAARAAPSDIAAMRAALTALHAHRGDLEASTTADVALHRAIVAATGNELLTRISALLEAGLRGRDQLAFVHGWDTAYLDLHTRVVDAIEAGDAAVAETAMRTLVTEAAGDVAKALSHPTVPVSARTASNDSTD
ncbi:MAG: FadR family transcriptional regulator [Thermomicrobiales bacterium]|nr:FadR family transcriptional regulator [Thermomicrobiales bacterium]